MEGDDLLTNSTDQFQPKSVARTIFGLLAVGVFIAIVAFVTIVVSGLRLVPSTGAPSQEGIEADPRPQSLIDFARANNNAKAAYENEDNELRQTAIKKQRDSEVAAAVPGGNFEGWTGTVQEIGEAGEDGTISIQPDGCECTVETYNNSFSNSLSDQKTIIKKNSPLFGLLMNLHKGDNVIFSGHIIEERSMTESGSVQDPAWIASFSEISATE